MSTSKSSFELQASTQNFEWHVSSFIGLVSNKKVQKHKKIAWNCKSNEFKKWRGTNEQTAHHSMH